MALRWLSYVFRRRYGGHDTHLIYCPDSWRQAETRKWLEGAELTPHCDGSRSVRGYGYSGTLYITCSSPILVLAANGWFAIRPTSLTTMSASSSDGTWITPG